MREIYSDQEPARVGFFQSLLESAGIKCFIRNQYTNTTMTGLPSALFFPVLCIVDDEDFAEADALIKATIHAPLESPREDWQCPQCKEAVPGAFDLCWNCQNIRPI